MLPFEEYCARVQDRIERVYGIRVITRDVPDPLTGDLDGCEIHIDYAVTPEQRLFLLAHLFGHTVQWNTSARAVAVGMPLLPPVQSSMLAEVVEYEREAAGYALTLLHEAGIHDADQWLSDYTACDMAYLQHFYRTGEKLDFESFWQPNSPCLEPRPVPRFTAARHRLRADGIVI